MFEFSAEMTKWHNCLGRVRLMMRVFGHLRPFVKVIFCGFKRPKWVQCNPRSSKKINNTSKTLKKQKFQAKPDLSAKLSNSYFDNCSKRRLFEQFSNTVLMGPFGKRKSSSYDEVNVIQKGHLAQCLKITEKVSFNIASEARYVYI